MKPAAWIRYQERPQRLLGLVVLMTSFAGYLSLLSPYPAFETDSAVLIVHAKQLQPYLTGYPLYLLLGHLLTLPPMISDAFALNVLSALCASAGLVFIYAAAARFADNAAAALCATLLFAFSPLLFENAIITEVYTMNLMFWSMIAWLAMKVLDTKEPLWTGAFCFVYLLSFGHHLLTVTALPAVLYLLSAPARKTALDRRVIYAAVAGGLATLALYAFMFARLYDEPTVHLAQNIRDFLERMTGSQYHGQMFHEDMATVLGLNISRFWLVLSEQFHPVVLWPAIIWIPILIYRQAAKTAFVLLAVVGNLAFALNYSIPDINNYFLPVIAGATILMAGAIAEFLRVVGQTSGRWFYRGGLLLIVLMLLGLQYWEVGHIGRERSESSATYHRYTRAVLDALEDRGFILTQDEKLYHGFLYHLACHPRYRGRDLELEFLLRPVSERVRRYYEWKHVREGRPFYFLGSGELLAQADIPYRTDTSPIQTLPGFMEEMDADYLALLTLHHPPGTAVPDAWRQLARSFGSKVEFRAEGQWFYCGLWAKTDTSRSVLAQEIAPVRCHLHPADWPDSRQLSDVRWLTEVAIGAGLRDGAVFSEIRFGQRNISRRHDGLNAVLIERNNEEFPHRLHSAFGPDLLIGTVQIHRAIP